MIFLSYRRDDAADITDRIYAGRLSRSSRRAADRLAHAFGEDESDTAPESRSGQA